MFIYLYNSAHNGDIFFTSEIAKTIIKSNPDKEFKLVPSCCSILFEDFVKKNSNVELMIHPSIWDLSESLNNYNNNEKNVFCLFNETSYFCNNDLYLNLWRILIDDNISFDIRNRIEYINNLFNNINNLHNISLKFDIKNYEELIPEIPILNINLFDDYIKEKKYDKKIFFYNFYGYSGQEKNVPKDFNDKFINKLLIENSNSLIIIPDSSNIKHINLISLKDDLYIDKDVCGKNLLLYANICNNCNDVYFKNNGGSLFILNKKNYNNNNIQFYFISDCNSFYDYNETIKKCYKLNCIFIEL